MRSKPKILITRLKSIGDVLFTLPSVNCLRQNFPGARISFLVNKSCAPLLAGFPAVDQVLVLDRDIYRLSNPFRVVSATWELLRGLRSERFTHAIDLHGFGETGLLTRWTGAPERWGVIYKPGRGFAYTKGVARRDDLHPIDGNLEVLKQAGLEVAGVENRFVLPGATLQEAEKLLKTLGFQPEEKFLFLQPFTSNVRKDWPLENFLRLADHFKSKGIRALFGGGPSDRERLELVLRDGYPTSAGASLMVSAALASRSLMAIGGDTGLLHLVVALQKPVLMLLNSPAIRTIPYGHRDWTLSPQPGGALASLPWQLVAEKIEQMLFGNAEPGQPVKLGLS
jgi:ADP-heptose:LPS heptosyltransferase